MTFSVKIYATVILFQQLFEFLLITMADIYGFDFLSIIFLMNFDFWKWNLYISILSNKSSILRTVEIWAESSLIFVAILSLCYLKYSTIVRIVLT